VRFIAFILLYPFLLASAESLVSLVERRLIRAAAAAEAANGMGRGEYYFDLLRPMPREVLEPDEMSDYVFFGKGWGRPQEWGIWSLGHRSNLFLRVELGREPRELHIHGRYFNGREATRVRVNGVLVSEAELHRKTIPLPPGLAADGHITIEFEHLNPLSPHDVDPSKADIRKLKFRLTELGLK
jgi:hypothetical protein